MYFIALFIMQIHWISISSLFLVKYNGLGWIEI